MRDGDPVDREVEGLRLVEVADDLEQRCLAPAADSDERYPFSATDRHIDVVELELTVPVVVREPQIPDLELLPCQRKHVVREAT